MIVFTKLRNRIERVFGITIMTEVKWQEESVLVGFVSAGSSEVRSKLGNRQKEFVGFAGKPFQSGWRNV